MTRETYTPDEVLKICDNLMNGANVIKTMGGEKLLIHERLAVLIERGDIIRGKKMEEINASIISAIDAKISKLTREDINKNGAKGNNQPTK